MRETYVFFVILLGAVITILLRAAPFLLFGGKRRVPGFVTYLGRVLPYAVMGMLVVYCLKDVHFHSAEGFLPALAAGGLVVLSYVWKRNTLVSIVLGTVVYMLLVQLVF